MIFNIAWKTRRVFLHLQCAFMFVRNLVFGKELSIKSFSYVNNLAVHGREVELLWDVAGCHKIVFKDLGVYPGNSSGIRFIFQVHQNPIEITFYGINGQFQTKEVLLEANQIKLANKFIPTTNTPDLISISLAKHKIRSTFSEYSFYTNSLFIKPANVSIDLKTPKITPQNINIAHEPFEKSNYLTKNIQYNGTRFLQKP